MALQECMDQIPLKAQISVAFETVEEAWFWFIRAQQARNDGARFSSGMADIPRPCEPLDILKIVDRLYRTRCLLHDHLLVMRHYGLRYLAPDLKRIRERRAAVLWEEAMHRLEPPLVQKGMISNIVPFPGIEESAAL